MVDMQFDNVDFEMDSKPTSDAFHATRDYTYEFGCIISSNRSLFSYLFSNYKVEFVKKDVKERL